MKPYFACGPLARCIFEISKTDERLTFRTETIADDFALAVTRVLAESFVESSLIDVVGNITDEESKPSYEVR